MRVNRAVVRIIMTDKAADKTDHNIRRRRRCFGVERRAVEGSRDWWDVLRTRTGEATDDEMQARNAANRSMHIPITI